MKFLKKAVCTFLMGIIMITILFSESVTAGAVSSNAYKDNETLETLSKPAKNGTPMPEYTVEGYYISTNEYQIVLSEIPEEEYEYLKSCDTYFNQKGTILFIIHDNKDPLLFHLLIEERKEFSVLYLAGNNILGRWKIEKNDRYYTYTCTFYLDSEAQQTIEKLSEKTEIYKMTGIAYYISDHNDIVSDYYGAADDNISFKNVKYNFSDEVKDETALMNEVSLKKTTLTAKKSDEKIKFSWKKVDGAEKYQIYYREKGESKYKKLATVSGSKTSYSTSKLDKNKTYQFKVRSYTESNGKKVYSKYSKVVTVK